MPFRKKNRTTLKLIAASNENEAEEVNNEAEEVNNEAEEVNNEAEDVKGGDVIMGSLSFETPPHSPRATIQVTPQVITPKTTDPSRLPRDTDEEEDSDDEEIMEARRKSADPLPFRAGEWQGDEDDDDKSNDDGSDDEQVINDEETAPQLEVPPDELTEKIFLLTQCITLLKRVKQKRSDERSLSNKLFAVNMYIENYKLVF